MMTFGGGFIDMGITTGANGCLKWLIQCDAVALGAVTFWEVICIYFIYGLVLIVAVILNIQYAEFMFTKTPLSH